MQIYVLLHVLFSYTFKKTGVVLITSSFYTAANQLPLELSNILLSIQNNIAAQITEIRLRINRPVLLTVKNGFYFVDKQGRVSKEQIQNICAINESLIEDCFYTLCGHSVYSLEKSIANGYIPMLFGHRAGICGTGYSLNDGSFSIKDITSINIRIARTEIIECDLRLKQLLQQNISGLIIAGEPSSGKTTILRSLIYELSILEKKTSVVDERCELMPKNIKLPLHCDVLCSYSKAVGMLQAIRVLSPQYIVCDEVGGVEEANALAQAANAGVSIIVGVHANSLQQLIKRPQTKVLLDTGAFDYACLLSGSNTPGKIERVEAL